MLQIYTKVMPLFYGAAFVTYAKEGNSTVCF